MRINTSIQYSEPSLRLETQEDGDRKELKIRTKDSRISLGLNNVETLISEMEKIVSAPVSQGENKKEFMDYLFVGRSRASKLNEFRYFIRVTESGYDNGTVYFQSEDEVKRLLKGIKEIKKKHEYERELQHNIQHHEEYVEYNGQKFFVNNSGVLNLSKLGIKSILDIKGLEKIKYITHLNLYENNIEKIEGLEHLIHLKNIAIANNQITKLNGLENLERLEMISLSQNPISDWEQFYLLKGLKNINRMVLEYTNIPKEIFEQANIKDLQNAQDFIRWVVNHLDAKKRKEKEQKESIANTKEFLQKASVLFQELSFKKIMEKTEIKLDDLENLLEQLILDGQIHAKIKRDGIIYLEKEEMEGIDKLLGAYKDWEDKQHDKKD